MKKELLSYIRENALSPFNKYKTSVKSREGSIFKTKDAKGVFSRVLGKVSEGFCFADTSNLFNCFTFTESMDEVKRRQEFFSHPHCSREGDAEALKKLTRPKATWKPPYGIVVVTEDDKTFTELQKLGCPTKFLVNEYDLEALEDYDIVQVIECENFGLALERLPQSVFVESLDEVYLERYVEMLSGWKDNIEILDKEKIEGEGVADLKKLMPLTENKLEEHLTKEEIEKRVDGANREISEKIKGLTIAGDELFTMLRTNALSKEFESIVKRAIESSGIPDSLVKAKIPVEIDENELNAFLKRQNAKKHTGIAEKIKREAVELRKVPGKLQDLSDSLIVTDFIYGVSQFMSRTEGFPERGEDFVMSDSKNLFLDNAQPISFNLQNHRCSILTGANSGGKTTLLEHIVQLISLFQMGLPVSGEVKMPIFSEVYYFAKNKGSMSKGAFETLLTQMSQIKPGNQTLVLADEIESVTEPGVAASIVAASAEYFLKKGCFLVIATHLGKEIQKNLPEKARIDGIEAKGLDEKYELIVDHNPVLGRLANSTPELIVEKMANSIKEEYLCFLQDYLRRDKLN